MEMVEVSKLNDHPKNSYFFDDIQGDNWQQFLESIQTSGVIEPIVISQNYTIVSGHQRVRACRELGINEIHCRIKIYDSEDTILKELLETNLRQRGIGNLNPIKFARCITELEKYYGVRQGSENEKGDNKIGEKNNSPHQKLQTDIANEIGLDKTQLRNYKKLLTLIPELQTLIETGEMPPTVGYKVWAKIPKTEQARLIAELGKDKIADMTQKQAQQYLVRIQELESENARLENDIDIIEEKLDEAKQHLPGDTEEILEENERLINKVRKEYERAEKYRKELELLQNKKTELQTIQPRVERFVFGSFKEVCYGFLDYLEQLEDVDASQNVFEIINEVERSIVNFKTTIGGIVNE